MRTAVKSALAAAACTAVACSATPVEHVEQDRAAPAKEEKMKPSTPSSGAASLPFARGRTFRSLDEYLAHLERQGAIDLPYWRQVAPGFYERVTTRMPRRAPERATRAELMERFGFTR